MVATGQTPTDNYTPTLFKETTKERSVIPTEIIDVSNPTKSCVLDDKIIDHYQYGGRGGMFGTTPVICGGTVYRYSSSMDAKCYAHVRFI